MKNKGFYGLINFGGRSLGLCLCLAAALLVSACFIKAKPMQVTYTIRSSTALKDYTVYLLVNDRRSSSSLVGAKAKDKDLFPELAGGRFDLKIRLDGGQNVATLSNLTAVEAVREAVSRRLANQGVSSTSHRAAAHLTVEVNIEQMLIDLYDGDLVARVSLSNEVYRDSSSVAKSSTAAVSNRMKLIGGTGGATVLSEALSQAVNDLDFSSINRF